MSAQANTLAALAYAQFKPADTKAKKPRMTAKRLQQQLDDAEQHGYVRGFNAGRRANKRPFIEFGAGVGVTAIAFVIAHACGWF